MAATITIRKIGITKLDVDCIVNAANSRLQHGGGVCGAIFAEAGLYELQQACNQYGGCPTGKAVITPGFRLKAKYVIHAVGPVWHDGKSGEEELLRSSYQESLKLAVKYGCRTIAFPLISSGVYGYPKESAWRVAIAAIRDFLNAHPSHHLDVTMAVIDEEIYQLGKTVLMAEEKPEDGFVFFWHEDEKNGCFSQWYPAEFEVEGIRYQHAEQYMMAKKALLFGDLEYYALIMHEMDPKTCKELGKRVRGFDCAIWNRYKEEIVYRANLEKFGQNQILKEALLATKNAVLAEASPYDQVWGIGLKADDPRSADPKKWNGDNLLGKALMKARNELRRK